MCSFSLIDFYLFILKLLCILRVCSFSLVFRFVYNISNQPAKYNDKYTHKVDDIRLRWPFLVVPETEYIYIYIHSLI